MSETDDPCNRTDSHLLSSGDASDGLGRAREHETDDDVDGSGLRALSRSPHPYHHQSHELPHAAEAIVYRSGQWPLASEVIGDCPRSPFPPFAVGSPTPPTAAATYSYSNSADSGTEADTEQPWRGLPAPRVRPHKGLRRSGHDLLPGGERAAVSSGVSTPLDHMSSSQLSLSRMLSPEVLEQEGRRVLLSPGSVKRAVTERDRRAIAEEVRRRKELARRGVEVLLLTALCVLVGRNGGVRSAVRVWKRELVSLVLVAASLCVLYPIRVALWAHYVRDRAWSKVRLAIPASFDPAPLLYPSVITLVVSLLVSVDNLAIVLPNVILAICSLPDQLVPTANGLELYNPSHWVLTCIPLLTSNCSQAVVHADVALSKPLFAGPATGELSVLLYPLHRSLCSVLHYLATTSLLPTELQLLSIALINTLFFSVSPQAVILKALLWVGGLCLLVLCGHVIQWGIALARVPRWRFRKASKPAQQRRSLLRQMLAMLRPMRNRKLDAFGEPLDSETADSWNGSDSADGVFYKPSLRKRTTLLGWPMADTTGAPSTATLAAPTVEDAPASPATDRREGTNVSDVEPLTHTQAHVRVSEQTQQLKPSSGGGGRRHTLPSVRSGHPPARGTHGASGQRRRRRRRAASGTVRSFFALTEAQAATRRWAYAGYVYACILFAIAFIVRPYVGRFALDGNEPVGWALGYLFGDLRRFRLEVVKANLERWIRLPARQVVLPSSMDDQGEGWVQRLRLATPPDGIGSANARLLLSAYWAFCVAAGLATVTRLSAVVEVDTRRKVFHFTVVAMFLPATFVDPCYTALALGLVLAIFLLLDLLRASQLPPLSRPLATFLAPYVDGRDLRGPVVVSHVFLLIGCAVPLWLSLASLPRSSSSIVATTGTNDVGDSSEPDPFAGWDLPVRETAMVAGVACVGLGDAAASLVGRRFGRNRWLWPGGKSLQGSAAFFAASFVGLVASAAWLRIGGWRTTADASGSGGGGVGAVASVGNAAVCAALASMTEAVLTGGNDNVIVPVVLWACVKSLGV